MQIEIKVPSVGESIKEAVLAQWYKQDGDRVRRDEPLFVIETDKVTLEVTAPADGVLKITVPEGATVAIGAVVGQIETAAAAAEKPGKAPAAETQPVPAPAPKAVVPEPAPAPAAPLPEAAAAESRRVLLSPSVRRLMALKQVDPSAVQATGPGDRVTKADVLAHLENRAQAPAGEAPRPAAAPAAGTGTEPAETTTRKPMSPIRKRIAARLLEAKNGTAMLTTFNEIDMGNVMDMRARFKEVFQKRHGVSLGFMSFFIKAAVQALREFPAINAFIEGDDVVYHDYYHIGVAVGSARGLVVPVIRHADRLGFADLERAINEFVKKIDENRLALADLEGGTFTITNGGVFGSLLSTPILNTPQSGILGMHKIEKRPVAVDDAVVIRPMMYVALSYDHRMVDGREAVTFLKRIKEGVENPERIMMEV
ncbi:MAG: 2-oxoglutarate dehydrogenase complex dihydrolipoyllysine-residue succinyltransferase [Thermodesulfobacteriota bacterium]